MPDNCDGQLNVEKPVTVNFGSGNLTFSGSLSMPTTYRYDGFNYTKQNQRYSEKINILTGYYQCSMHRGVGACDCRINVKVHGSDGRIVVESGKKLSHTCSHRNAAVIDTQTGVDAPINIMGVVQEIVERLALSMAGSVSSEVVKAVFKELDERFKGRPVQVVKDVTVRNLVYTARKREQGSVLASVITHPLNSMSCEDTRFFLQFANTFADNEKHEMHQVISFLK
jgi:hypothetical protein